jgi:hypothetical protein
MKINQAATFGIVSLIFILPVRAQTTDVAEYLIQKNVIYDQSTSSATPLDPIAPYSFSSYLKNGSTGTILSSSSLTPPSSSPGAVEYLSDANALFFQQFFTSPSALDAAFASGTYNLTMQTSTPNTYTVALTLGANNYPNAIPQITSMTNASWSGGFFVVSDVTQPVSITWNNPNSANAYFQIFNTGINSTSDSGTSTTITIPANSLSNNTVYLGNVSLTNVSETSSSIPDVSGGTYYSNQVNFLIQTGTPAASSKGFYVVEKNQVMVQTSNSAPVDGAGNFSDFDPAPYQLFIESPIAGSATGPSPGNTNFALTYDTYSTNSPYRYSSAPLASLSSLNSTFPDGTYTVPGGATVSLTGDTYPTAPQIMSVNGATPVWNAQGQLTLNPTVSNNIVWSTVSMTNFSTDGNEKFEVKSTNGATPSVDFKQQAGLAAAAGLSAATSAVASSQARSALPASRCSR